MPNNSVISLEIEHRITVISVYDPPANARSAPVGTLGA
jgi:hypothetical protein